LIRASGPWLILPSASNRGQTSTRDRRSNVKVTVSEPTAGIIDSQGVRAADTVPTTSRGYDAGKKINGRKRFIVTDTLGLLVVVWVVAACWQDRDGARGALLATYASTPIRHVRADQGFAGRPVDWARTVLTTTVEIVREP
jgi:hypothetical protein